MSNQLETEQGIYSWDGPLKDGTMVTTPSGALVTFYSLVSRTHGIALEWFRDYLK